jgi:WD40 repeat protein
MSESEASVEITALPTELFQQIVLFVALGELHDGNNNKNNNNKVRFGRLMLVCRNWYRDLIDPFFWHSYATGRWGNISGGQDDWIRYVRNRLQLNHYKHDQWDLRRKFVCDTGVWCVSFSKNRVYVGSANGSHIIRWPRKPAKLKPGKIDRSNVAKFSEGLQFHTNTVRDLLVDESRAKLLSSSWDTHLAVWDLESEERLQSVQVCPSSLFQVRVHPQLPYIATCCEDGTGRILDYETLKEVAVLAGHQSTVLSIDFNSSIAITASCDDTVKVFDVRSGGSAITTLTHHTQDVRSCQLQDNWILSTGADKTLCACDVRKMGDNKAIQRKNIPQPPWSLKADGSKVLVAGTAGMLAFVELDGNGISDYPLLQLNSHCKGAIVTVTFDEKCLALASEDYSVMWFEMV